MKCILHLEAFLLMGFAALLVTGCSTNDDAPIGDGEAEGDDEIEVNDGQDMGRLQFFDEYIIPEDFKVNQVKTGGFSDLSYDGEYFYTVSDQVSSPHIFKFTIEFQENRIDTLRFKEVISISSSNTELLFDTEGIDFDPDTHRFTLSSEGYIEKGKDGFIAEVDQSGKLIDLYELPDYFKADFDGGPQNDGVFEGLSRDTERQGIWVSTELPLQMDLPDEDTASSEGAIRITHFDKETKKPTEQFIYPKKGFPEKTTISVDGVSAILEYSPHRFLVLERSFSTDLENLGFQNRLFAVDAREATNTLDMKNMYSQLGEEVIPAKRQLLLDFADLKERLTNQTLDNLEGMALGPELPNGNRSLVLISDNNFNEVIPQLNQVIVLEIVE